MKQKSQKHIKPDWRTAGYQLIGDKLIKTTVKQMSEIIRLNKIQERKNK